MMKYVDSVVGLKVGAEVDVQIHVIIQFFSCPSKPSDFSSALGLR